MYPPWENSTTCIAISLGLLLESCRNRFDDIMMAAESMRHSLRFTSHYDYRDHRSPAYTLHNFAFFSICLCIRFPISILKMFDFSYIFNTGKNYFFGHSMSLWNITNNNFSTNLFQWYKECFSKWGLFHLQRKLIQKKLKFFWNLTQHCG